MEAQVLVACGELNRGIVTVSDARRAQWLQRITEEVTGVPE